MSMICTATTRNRVKCTNEFVPNSPQEQYCSNCLQKMQTRREQNRRASAKLWRRRRQQLLQSPTGLAKPVAHRCHDCSRLQSECSSSLFKQGAVRCVECATKHLEKANLAYSRLRAEMITKRISESTITSTPTARPTALQPMRPHVATGPSVPHNTKSLSSTPDPTTDIAGSEITYIPTTAAATASQLIGNIDPCKQPNQYAFSESATSSTQTVPGTEDDDAVDSPMPTRAWPVSPVPPKALPPNIQPSSLVLKRPMPVRPPVTGKRAAAGAAASTDALVRGTPPEPKSAMKLFQTPIPVNKRRKILHTGGAARDTAMTQVGGTPQPHETGRVYMTGQSFVSNVQAQLDLKKQQLLAAPLVRPVRSAFQTSLLGPRNNTNICCALYKFDCTNSLSDPSFCCGGKPKPVLQVHTVQFRLLLYGWPLSFIINSAMH